MKYYAKQFFLSFLYGSTVLFWGLLFQLSRVEIMAVAVSAGILQYLFFGSLNGAP